MAWNATKCLEQLDSGDKDFRYMALSDLYTELQKDAFKVDTDNEKRIVTKLLTMVADDRSGDVKGFAVKCVGPLASRAQKNHVKLILEKLRDYLVDEQREDEVRDIASIGLKGVISELPDSQAENIQEVVKTVPTRIVTAIGDPASSQEVIEHCLDVLDDLLKRWGKHLAAEKGLYTKASRSVSPHLTSSRSSIRKKAINCLARLAVALPDDLFGELMESLLKNIKESKKADHIRTFLSAIGSISRHVGFRLARYLDQVIPILVQYSDHPKFQEDDDIRETCFQALESIILRCPKDADRFLPEIIKLILKFMAHDPNYAGYSDEDEDAMDVDEDEDFGDEDYDYSDDDDLSWKVRKASTRCLAAVIKTHPNDLPNVFDQTGAFLVKRFTEREENVKVDVYATFVELLNQTAIVSEHIGAGEASVADKVRTEVPNAVKAVAKDLAGKSEKSRIGALQLLRTLVTVVPNSLEGHVGALLPGLSASLEGRATTSPIKIEALAFLRALLKNHKAAIFHEHLAKITKPTYKCVGDKYTKIAVEGLLVCSEVAKVLPAKEGADYATHVGPLYNAALEKLKQVDVDQEVKEGAIECMGLVLSLLGDKITKEVPDALKLLRDRLNNEVTRLVAVKTFDQIGQSKLKLDLSPVLADVIKTLATFLRQQNRQLKLATLSTLTTLVRAHGKNPAAAEQFPAVLSELSAIVNDQDLHLAHLGLKLAAAIVHSDPTSADLVKSSLLPRCFELLKSSFLQGLALESMLALFKELMASHSKSISFDEMLTQLMALGTAPETTLSKQSFHAIAQCIAVLVVNNEAGREATVNSFAADIKKPKNDNSRLLSLYCIGEIGRRVDLSGIKDIKKTILSCFESSAEDAKTAASVALGCLAVGKLRRFLPDILNEIKENPKRQYLLLGSLREAIVRLSVTSKGIESLRKYLDQLLVLLFEHTGTEEEGNRNVVAECLGKLAFIDPPGVIAALKQRTQSPSVETRACVTTAIKATITEKPQAVDEQLREHISSFLDLLHDKEIVVRKAALLTLNYAAHLKPSIIRDLLPKYMPALYSETTIKKELIKEYEVGPFKHLVDTGIELRQAAFETIYTLLDTCLTRLDMGELINHVASAINDTYDIQMLGHLILARVAKKAGASLVSGLDVLVEPLRTALNSKPKGEAVQQQIERHDEMIRSTLRAIHAISQVEGIDNAPHFQEFLASAVVNGPLADKYTQVVRDAGERQ